MEINSLQGSTAYSNAVNSTKPVENTQLADQNIEASKTSLEPENTRPAQDAFKVSITQEARDQLVKETQASEDQAVQTPPSETSSGSPVETQGNSSQIVNIVA